MNDGVRVVLYSWFSNEEYAASWMMDPAGRRNHFLEWLSREHPGGVGYPRGSCRQFEDYQLEDLPVLREILPDDQVELAL